MRSSFLGLHNEGNAAQQPAAPVRAALAEQYGDVVPRVVALAEAELQGPPSTTPDALSLLAAMAEVEEVAERLVADGIHVKLRAHVGRCAVAWHGGGGEAACLQAGRASAGRLLCRPPGALEQSAACGQATRAPAS